MNQERIKQLKQEVCEANLALPRAGLVKLTWGNVSVKDEAAGVIVIKPSGVAYDAMTPDKMVVTNLEGNLFTGQLKPSSDLATHVVLYQNFPEVSAIVHTHSKWAVSFAQAGRDIPAYGTTHADAFYGAVPCTRMLSKAEIERGYEQETGRVIIEAFNKRQIDPNAVPGVVVRGHGPFSWGKNSKQAVENSIILDEVAEMALATELLSGGEIQPIPSFLLDKHYWRKHGKTAYYGQ
ncbi:L-ribulose-5-phosphate 4-epimerase [Listeria floridensis FSL S10-1187]|uniref:L-ribulose-5-phosphate 4-epimerase n=1 Tax=Listeria floridensis FSL S10-1187 TaxID=1265817 RepID=A0ABN0REU1_9LIST|nr:L-ribulose-5-phosphate 4-epimerase [Listeria floridensis]EUJ31668.1 L-ribulose-5-phosphate 4-epimerase [Listeria floridensis FSL S10-1187]